jgi:2-polyprenyl-3-methyl-5-hydroxy-6-metoxy-1,4-benzoquinol methylase
MGMTDHQELALKKFIAKARGAVIGQHPARQEHFDIYANEAIFGLSVIKDDLIILPRGATVLEVGAGALLLSGYLASSGLRVYALEPIAAGFSHFHELQGAVVKHYATIGVQLKLIESTIEEFFDTERFDYIFSINAFEHVRDVERAITNTYLSLKHGGALRIYCPNYHFPYEPHFNIPTLINKKLTQYFFATFIMTSPRMPQPKETWEGLNWINVTQVNRFIRGRFETSPIFNPLATYQIVTRVLQDLQFSERRAKWITLFLRVINRAGLLKLFKFIPVTLSPVMDFRVERVPLKG